MGGEAEFLTRRSEDSRRREEEKEKRGGRGQKAGRGSHGLNVASPGVCAAGRTVSRGEADRLRHPAAAQPDSGQAEADDAHRPGGRLRHRRERHVVVAVREGEGRRVAGRAAVHRGVVAALSRQPGEERVRHRGIDGAAQRQGGTVEGQLRRPGGHDEILVGGAGDVEVGGPRQRQRAAGRNG